MESLLDEISGGIAQMTVAMERYQELLPAIHELSAYYGSAEWNRDYDDDRNGKFPAGLKRGVLSEDAVYDALSDHRELICQMLNLVSACIQNGTY